MVNGPDSLLGQDANRASHVVALDLLARVRAARVRLGDPNDNDALHDFRVSVRRLRSWLDVQAVLLGRSAPRRAHRWLRRLAKATNPSRDDEVFADWLTADRAQLAVRNRGAADWLVKRITRHRKRAVAALLEEIDLDLDRACDLLAERLPRYDVPHDVERGSLSVPFATEMSALVRAQASALRRRLGAVHAPADVDAIHRARIVGKRLRYLLEPVQDLVAEGAECVAELKTLQDLLGEHHDAHVWLGTVRAALPRVPRVALRAGLVSIATHIERRAAERYTTLAGTWLVEAPPLFARLERVADALSGPVAPRAWPPSADG